MYASAFTHTEEHLLMLVKVLKSVLLIIEVSLQEKDVRLKSSTFAGKCFS